MPDLQQLTREIQALGQQRRAQLAGVAQPPFLAGRDFGLTIGVGARVLDLVSGEEGVILDGKSEHIITSAA